MSHRHFLLYKPTGYLSQFINNGPKRSRKRLLGDLGDFPTGTMAIGRLDERSEGLLLLTTDGALSHQICSGAIEKEYYAQVDGIISEEAVERLRAGLCISVKGKPYSTKPCQARLMESPNLAAGFRIRDSRHGPTSWMSITLTEGKFRQVRKMTAAVGFPTLRLIRPRVGQMCLDNLLPGEFKEVSGFSLYPS